MRYAYEALLRLYPTPYRAMFGREMAQVFEEASGDYRPRGLVTYLAFLCTEFAGLLAGAMSTWTEEYISRSRRRLSIPFLSSLAAGAVLAGFTQGCFVVHMTLHEFNRSRISEFSPVAPERIAVMLLAAGTLLLVSLFSVAFVWNMRVIGNRAGRLKPIWMPGRASNARITRRDQTLHRDSSSQRRKLHRAGR